ncbi:GIY-YIG nuclease family protein [Psychroflexus aestuariivivens]|uniref:GIY-YIG nuclease family protein n=1 Tax=Psychroflexus aestuariivivens TaxID=1795040 RepID=UPI000FDA692E|nr:GIY-YIG nuclease family protein [Psychroflexus aestuariivivens]
MRYLYIIYSGELDKYYVGETQDVEKRLMMHNEHHFKKAFTRVACDWELKLVFACQSREDALFLEKFIKRIKSRKFIQRVINNSEILVDILKKNSHLVPPRLRGWRHHLLNLNFH